MFLGKLGNCAVTFKVGPISSSDHFKILAGSQSFPRKLARLHQEKRSGNVSLWNMSMVGQKEGLHSACGISAVRRLARLSICIRLVWSLPGSPGLVRHFLASFREMIGKAF